MADPDARVQAARAGAREAEQLDLALRGLELAEVARAGGAPAATPPPASPLSAVELENELRRVHAEYAVLLAAHRDKLAELAAQVAFNDAMRRSRPWRLLQTARRLFGRSW